MAQVVKGSETGGYGKSSWLAASYHFPSVYSCSLPMTSKQAALALPTPGPATVRLALVRNGIELFGLEYVRDELFEVILSMEILIKPPRQVSFSTHLLRMYKATEPKPGRPSVQQESIGYREHTHCEGVLTVFTCVPLLYLEPLTQVLNLIGYWGHSDSLCYCLGVREEQPLLHQCLLPLQTLVANGWINRPEMAGRRYFCATVSELRSAKVSWEEVVENSHSSQSFLKFESYAWPLVVEQHWGDGKRLCYQPFNGDSGLDSSE